MMIVLDNIRSAFNVGSVMRTCDATKCSLITVGYTPQPLGETRMLIKKTAINAEAIVPFSHYQHAAEVFAAFPDKVHIGVELYHDAINIYDFLDQVDYNTEDIILWLGNEIHGLSQDMQDRFTYTVYLPMEGIKESLNVSNTTTAMIYLLKTKDHRNKQV
jgi:23S rRNA (guanosine2251-2'-O)-methyltransferase